MKLNSKKIVEGVLAGHKRYIARCISYIENNEKIANEILEDLYSHCGQAHVIGITGPPGAGKSTLVGTLVTHFRQQNKKCGLILVDPSSPFTGGAILGDRIRMPALTSDEGVYIRSMSTRGSLGGLAKATRDAIKVLDAAGYDLIIVETVGIGQSETDIIKTSDTVVVVTVPGLGDHIQTLKAGIMEIADIFTVNKSDLDGASRTVRELKLMIEMSNYSVEERPPVLSVIATENSGVDTLCETIEKYHQRAAETGELEKRRKQNIATELRDIMQFELIKQINKQISGSKFDESIEKIYNHQVSPYKTSKELLETVVKLKGDE